MAFLKRRMAQGTLAAIAFLSLMGVFEAIADSLGSSEAHARLAAAKDVFETNCAICHGYDGITLVEGAPNFAKGEWLEKKDAALLKTIRDGKEQMPPWKDVISPSEQKAALAYARTIVGSRIFADTCASLPCRGAASPDACRRQEGGKTNGW